MSGPAVRMYHGDPVLATKPAHCCRCGRPFETEINPEIRGELGTLIRGERQVFRLCVQCRGDDAFDVERARKSAHAQS